MSKVILITGGSSGIGKAIATYLSKNNAYIVYGSSRDLKKLENVSFLPIKLDVTSEESISDCVQKIIKDQVKERQKVKSLKEKKLNSFDVI